MCNGVLKLLGGRKMSLFEIGICIGGIGVIIMLIIANDNHKNKPVDKATKVMFKIGGALTLVGGVLGVIGTIITQLAG